MYYMLVLPLGAIGVFLLYQTCCLWRSRRRGDIVPNILSNQQYAACVCDEPGDILVNVGFADGRKRDRVFRYFFVAFMAGSACCILVGWRVGYLDLIHKQSTLDTAVVRIQNMEAIE